MLNTQKDTDPTIFRNEYHEFESWFAEHICIYTDGFKSEGKVASTATSNKSHEVFLFQTKPLFTQQKLEPQC